MIKPRIIVTGATGKTGRVVVAELLKAGYPVRAMVHREDGRSAQLKAQGAEIAVADMSVIEVQIGDLKGIDADSLIESAVVIPHLADSFVEEPEVPVSVLIAQANGFGVAGSILNPKVCCIVLG